MNFTRSRKAATTLHPSTVAKALFDKINAATKDFVWFENSGHFPFTEEPSKRKNDS